MVREDLNQKLGVIGTLLFTDNLGQRGCIKLKRVDHLQIIGERQRQFVEVREYGANHNRFGH